MASRKEQKAAARERLRQEMEQRKQRARRNRVIGIVSAVVVVVAAVVGIGIAVQSQRAKSDGPAPPGAVANGLAIPVGQQDAPVTLTVYEDFRCPACKQFEDTYNDTIEKLEKAGKLRVEYHIATIIDANQPNTTGSHIAGNAAACAYAQGGSDMFREYHDVLYKNQPPEQYDGFTKEQVQTLAKNVPGLSGSKFTSCVEDGTYLPWLQKVQSEFDKRFNPPSTPSLILDGKVMFGGQQRTMGAEMASPQALEHTVDKLAAKRSSKS